MSSQALHIRPLTKQDQALLWDMLYHAIYVAPGQPPFARDIINAPDIWCYAAEWMIQPCDAGFAAEVDNKPVGAVWLRCWTGEQKGYGYVDASTPELTIALLPPV